MRSARRCLYAGGTVILAGLLANLSLPTLLALALGNLLSPAGVSALGALTVACVVLEKVALAVGGALIGAGIVVRILAPPVPTPDVESPTGDPITSL